MRDLGGEPPPPKPLMFGRDKEVEEERNRAVLLARIDALSAELASHEKVIFKGFDILAKRIDKIDNVANKLGV
jgi:hypothetical protein